MSPDRHLLAEALGTAADAWAVVKSGGYTQSRAWRVETSDGSVFVKQAEEAGSLHMLRREAVVYQRVQGPFLPAFVGFADSGERALLAVELLDDALWPPPYPEDASPLLAALDAVAQTTPPAELPAHGPWLSRWERVATDPEPFLSLRLCSRAWIDASVEALLDAERDAVFEGHDLVHNDIYAANVAFTERGAVLVDWGAAVRGSRWIDVALSHLSVRVEDGPPLPTPRDAIPFVAAIAGHFAVEAPAPLPEWADPGSTLREDMKGDLVHALRWCAEELGLPPLS